MSGRARFLPLLGWPAALFLLSLVARLTHLLTVRGTPFFTHLGLDPLAYDEWGVRISHGAWIGDRVFYQDPLYPYFLGVVYAVFGHSLSTAVALQMVLGSLVAPLLFAATRRWFDLPSAAATGWLAALYGQSIFYEGMIEKTWLGVFLVAAALASLSAALAGRPWGWPVTGALLGLACLVRGNLLLVYPVLAGLILLSVRPRAAALRSLATLAFGALVVLGPIAVRNRAVGGEWVLTTSQGGQNFYIGNNPVNRNGQYEPLPFVGANPKYEEKGFMREAERRAGRPLLPSEISSFWYREAFAWIRSHPDDWLRLTWIKFRNYWGAYEIPDNLDYYLCRQSAPVLRLPLPGFGLVAPLGLLGAAACIRRTGWPRALILFLLIHTLSVVAFFVFARYRMAMMPALLPFAGAAVIGLGRRARAAWEGAGSAPAWKAAFAVLPLWALVNVPVRAPETSWSLRAARTLGLPTRVETTATAHYNLGLSFASQAEEAAHPEDLLRRAEAELREALRQDPRYASVYAELGKVLARQGRDREAIDVYRQALALDPARPRTWHVVGILYERLGETAGAESAYAQALRLDPDRSDSAKALGRVLLALGRRGEAAEAFRRAVALSPQDPEARAGLRSAGGGP